MAQETKLKRKDLKKPDQFLATSNEFLIFLDRYKTILFSVLFGLFLAWGGFLFLSSQQKAEDLEMESLYFQMIQKVKESKSQSADELISQLNSLFQEFKDGNQKLRAGLLLADTQYRNQRYDDALASFTTVQDHAPPGTLNYFLAQSGIAHSYEAKKDFTQAIAQYKKIIDQPGDFPLFYTYLGLSRCYEFSRDSKNSELILREMQNKFSKHAGLDQVNLSLKRLEGPA